MRSLLSTVCFLGVFYTSFAQVSTDPSGNVGIGTTSPANKLDVNGGINSNNTSTINGLTFSLYNTYYRKLQAAGYNLLFVSGDGSSQLSLPYSSSAPAHFQNYGLVVDGNVGIGTTSPNYKLDVTGITSIGTTAAGAYLRLEGKAGMSQPWQIRTSTLGGLQFTHDAGLANVTFFDNGYVGLGTSAPQAPLHVQSSTVGSNIAKFSSGGIGGGTRGLTIYSNDSYVKLQVSDNVGNIANWAHLVLNPDGGNVGIGTTSPASKLHVDGDISIGSANAIRVAGDQALISYSTNAIAVGSGTPSTYLKFNSGGTERMRISANGNLGIGSVAPSAKLHIGADANNTDQVLIEGSGSTAAMHLGQFANTTYFYNNAKYRSGWTQDNTSLASWGMAMDAGNDLIAFARSAPGSTSFSNLLVVQGDGNVGIGTTNMRGFKLAVNGSIRAQEIKVEAAPWPDYVFAPQYQLPDLKATEQFIKENKHLPEIPSATEVEKDGVNLGEMNAKLLKKIEELTLYLIEQDKKFEKKIAEQQREIDQLKSKK